MLPSLAVLPTAGNDAPPESQVVNPTSSTHVLFSSAQSHVEREDQEARSTMQRASFSPFFTLIDDTSSSSTYHPLNVHYIFSDDDQDILTSACLASISEVSSQTSSGLTVQSTSSSTALANAQSQKESHSKEGKETQHRTIVVDVDDTGTAITSAHSLLSSWQVLTADLTSAPTWETNPTDEDDAVPARFMLRIKGIEARNNRRHHDKLTGKPKDSAGDIGPDDFQALIEDFEQRMATLRTVVDAGDKRHGVEPLTRPEEESSNKVD